MNQVEYTLFSQRIIALLGALAFLGLSSILAFIDPSSGDIYLALVLVLIAIFLFTLLSMINFWWVFRIKKVILEKNEVNNLLFRSGTVAILLNFLLVMNMTKNLDIFSLLGTGIVMILYLLWL